MHLPLTGSGRRLLFASALAAPIFLVGGAQAGFLDAIFGGGQPEQPRYYYYQPQQPAPQGYVGRREPLGVTVRPRAQRVKRDSRDVRELREGNQTARSLRKDRPVRAAAAAAAPAPKVELDPAKNPNWFLQDPTLRRGDIVVLKDEVLVFQGGGRVPYAREDFASLKDSRMSKAEREQIGAMAGLPVETPMSEARQKTAAAATTAPSE